MKTVNPVAKLLFFNIDEVWHDRSDGNPSCKVRICRNFLIIRLSLKTFYKANTWIKYRRLRAPPIVHSNIQIAAFITYTRQRYYKIHTSRLHLECSCLTELCLVRRHWARRWRRQRWAWPEPWLRPRTASGRPSWSTYGGSTPPTATTPPSGSDWSTPILTNKVSDVLCFFLSFRQLHNISPIWSCLPRDKSNIIY